MTEFTITSSSGENGTISPVGSMLVSEGSSLTFTITPRLGYVSATVVDGFSVGPLTSYTFSNVQDDHSINVVFTVIPFSVAQFRLDFPEFVNTVKFLDSTINLWARVGDVLLNVERWGELRYIGLELWVAHNVVLQAKDIASVNAGGMPSDGQGVISNQSAGGVTVGIDTAVALEAEAGHYNQTVYGTRFKRLMDITGMGGAQLI